MTGIMGVISYGIGTIIGFIVVGVLGFWFIQDITQKKHTVLRNYPVIGRLRFFLEEMGEYFRQYFFAGDRAEMPFNRAHACGCRHARELTREHVRIVHSANQSIALNMLYPYPDASRIAQARTAAGAIAP